MERVIRDLEEWLGAFNHESEGFKDKDAIKCIQNALVELEKYYTEYDNEDFRGHVKD